MGGRTVSGMSQSSLRVGAHVDQADPVAEAVERKADLVQFFLGDPQGWKAPEVRFAGGAAALRAAAESAGVDLYVHAPYVLNVATSNNRIRIPSRKLLAQHVQAAAEIGARGIVVHGGHVLKDDDPELGFENWVKTFERMELPIPVLIENTAGGEQAMARRLERIARLWERIADRVESDRIGFCLDTCHAYAGGEELAGLVERVKAVTGRIDLVHANDSRDAFDSGADRHANLGSGSIGGEAVAAVVAAAGAPVVVETPGGVEGQAADIAYLREAAGG
ncbi:deoxyribonuclease-4 [Motilibacter peucedani]|uniref:Deoxyribonuclease-4 n=2 Tax=Motilibacter peucedani TaxID=598650 RepID=A0A420XU87_9ACTN|nr:deoxyribonuclease-4 [Motilibacter peucedani]